MAVVAEVLGTSPAIRSLLERVTRVLERVTAARRPPPILIGGETGTGKGLLARALHRAGPRAAGPFVDVNCAAIPDTLLEAELFGFERGAFTDARQAKPGLFQAARGGTMFLDEIGLLPEALQSKLLTVVEEQTVRRLGSTRSEPVDAWIIAATSEDLATAPRERAFRPDLYHRLSVLPLWLPPLRDRGEDILFLAEHFLARACRDYDLPPRELAADARAALAAHPWPGNVRELSNVMERVALLGEGHVITRAMLGLPAPASAGALGRDSLRRELDGVERERLLAALAESSWNLSRAAAALGMPRNTLRYRIARHGLRPPETPAPASAARAPTGDAGTEPRRLALLRAIVPVDAGSARRLRALDVAEEKIHAFGGRVEERTAEGLLGTFGLEPVEDAPRRAAHAALATAKAVDREDASGGVRLALHVAPVAVGRDVRGPRSDPGSRGEPRAALDALLAAAPPGAIVVSPAAVPFLARRFQMAPPAGPAGPWRLVGHGRAALGEAGGTPFVGRRFHLELLHAHLETSARGHGQVLGVVGDVGIGKSRLVAEFRRSLAGREVTCVEATCPSHGAAIPYLPIAELLREVAGVEETDGADAVAAKVRRTLTAAGVEPDASAPYLLQLLGLREAAERLAALTPEAVRSRTLETLRHLTLGTARRRPLVLVVEDLQWIDRSSEECVAALVDDLVGAAVMLVATYRPGHRPPWIDRSYSTQIALPPLSPEESRAVVRARARGAVPDALADRILARAEGNPFFLEELCRAMEEAADPEAVPVPETIEEVLLARIERLPEAPRRLLQLASVLGRVVPAPLMRAVWSGPGPLEPALAPLLAAELLHQRAGRDEPAYAFRHAMIQEIAAASLTPEQRRHLHGAAGAALERLHATRPEEVYDELARHYAAAAEPAKAVEYLGRLAEQAARGFAHEEAVRALRDALGHARQLPADVRDRRGLELVLRMPSSLLPLGRVQEILELLLPEEARLAQIGDPALTGPYHFLLGRAFSFLGDRAQATQHARRAIVEATRCDDDSTTGKAYGLLALEAVLSGQALQAVEHARRAVVRLERTGERSWLADAHWLMGASYVQIGEFAAALAAEEAARTLGEAIGDQRVQASAAWVTGIVRIAMGDHDAGLERCEAAVRLAPDPLNVAITTGWLGFARVEVGDGDRALPLLEEAVRLLNQFRFREFEGWFTVFLAEAQRLRGDVERAEETAARALAVTTRARFLTGVGWAHLALGRIALARADLARADARLAEALRVFVTTHSRYEIGRVHIDLGAVARARGNRETAAKHLGEAFALFDLLGVPRYVARIERLAAELGVPLGRRR
jgi:transcriptional regulator with AAA-type ATPase domain/tetratricopeptide (TPR) repeat protein